MPTTMQIDAFNEALQRYSELTFTQIAGLAIILFLAWLLVQAWISRVRVKASAVVDEKRAGLEVALVKWMANYQEQQSAAEQRSIDARKDAHAALDKMAQALTYLGTLSDKQHGTVIDRVDLVDTHVLSIKTGGTEPLVKLIGTTNELMAEIEVMGAALKTASLETNGRLDALIETMAIIQRDLNRVQTDIGLAQESISQQIAEACKEKEKRRTDSKPVVIIPLPAEDDPDKNEATG